MDTRLLNTVEEYLYLISKTDIFNIQVYAWIKESIEDEILQKAIKIVQLQHFYLNIAINETNGNYLYNPINRVMNLTILQINDSNDIYNILYKDLNTKMDLTIGHSCRIMNIHYQKESIVVLTIDHSVSDGICSVELLKSILLLYCQLHNGNTINPDNTIEPALIEKNNFPLDLPTLNIKHSEIVNWSITKKVIPLNERETSFIEYMIDKARTKSLILLCKQKNTTVYSFLTAIVLKIMATKLHDENICRDFHFPINNLTQINLRPYFKSKISNKQLGLSIFDFISHYYIENYEDIWILAKDIKWKVHSFSESFAAFSLLDSFISNYETIKPSGEEVIANHEIYSPCVNLSNLGIINIDDLIGLINIDQIGFRATINNFLVNPYGIYCAVNNCNEKLVMNFCYCKPYWTSEEADRFVKNFHKLLISL